MTIYSLKEMVLFSLLSFVFFLMVKNIVVTVPVTLVAYLALIYISRSSFIKAIEDGAVTHYALLDGKRFNLYAMPTIQKILVIRYIKSHWEGVGLINQWTSRND
jgi:hypothetical protein